MKYQVQDAKVEIDGEVTPAAGVCLRRPLAHRAPAAKEQLKL